MARPRKTAINNAGTAVDIIPALSPEAKENELIALATSVAERQLREGTASSQLIVHYLKLGTEKERLERQKLEEENKLLRAKTNNIESSQRSEELFKEAIAAMATYKGSGDGV